MRGVKAKALRRQFFGDLSARREVRRYAMNNGIIKVLPGSPRDLYQKAKKKGRIS